ncbi:hypothetical protein AV530_013982 [Patagioenas fasciata monilis]|uniref:PH domain-containing protein n=1 Tax=Patagioenas fasciata monilis TaxID=372326 RepID=A0A1V4J571_PATFA|nr:hypothetical protein AV530_013982 [Patagioenas fasciata monilis]
MQLPPGSSLKQRSPPPDNSHKPEKEWPVRNLKVYLGIKKKLRPPTCWGFTVFYENEKHEKQQWYLCCDTQADLREWFATFLHVQHGGSLWPSESSKRDEEERGGLRHRPADPPAQRLSWRCDTLVNRKQGALGDMGQPLGTQGSPLGHWAALGDTGQPSGTHASPASQYLMGVPPAPDPLASPQGPDAA